MTQVSCNLDEFFITRLYLSWREPAKQTESTLGVSFDYDVARHNKDTRRYRLTLRVQVKGKEAPPLGLTLEAEIVGFITLPKEVNSEHMDYLVRLNGCTILYGILRGEVAMASGSFPSGKFILPTVMMEDVVAGVEERKASSRKRVSAKRNKPAKTTRK